MLRIRVVVTMALVCLVSFLAPGSAPRAISPDVVISQVYGAGGNSGAVYRNDYVELFNRGETTVSLEGWSVQYASATGTGNFGSNAIALLAGSLAPGQFYLVQLASGTNGVSLPTPDATGTVNMSGSAGKIALVTSTTGLACNGGSTVCSAAQLAQIKDLVGYGSANFFEGAGAAPTLSATTAAFRLTSGCTDTDNNAADFIAAAPAPRNTNSPLLSCAGPTNPAGVAAADPSSLESGGTSLLTVAVTPGANPPSTGLGVWANLSTIGGPSAQVFFDDGTHGDASAGDNVFSYLATATGTPGQKTLAVTISDAQARSSTTAIALTIEPPLTPIYELQGPGLSSPFDGQLVATRGIVTARKGNGFFIQLPDGEGDGDELTSDGIFVFTSSAPPSAAAIGNEVRVIGTLQEFVPPSDPGSPPMTEIGFVTIVSTLSTGNTLPAPIVLQPSFTSPTGTLQQLERFEGMRVTANDLTAISPTAGSISEANATSTSNGVFYVVLEGIARPVREPGYDPAETLPPDAPADIPAFDGNPERLRVDSDGQIGASRIEVVAGQTIDEMTGVLDYGFRAYTILPDPGAASEPQGAAATIPIPVPAPHEFTVASYNMQRFFDTVNDPDKSDAVLNAAAMERRLSKASLAIREILRTPDIVGAIEIENLAVLQAIASRVNADAVAAGDPDPAYAAYLEEGNDIGGIDVGFLVKSSRVEVISVEQVGKDITYHNVEDDREDPLNDRPPLVLRAAVHAQPGSTPFPITVILNHLRSLAGIDDPGTAGQRVRDKRRLQAEFLAGEIQLRQAADPHEAIVSIGDYNAFQFSDGFVDSIGTIKGDPAPFNQVVSPSADLVDPNLVNAGDALGAQAQYSYTFDGNAQALDHVLLGAAAAERFVTMVYARLGADFPESLRGDASRPERLSDHDAAVAYFNADTTGPAIENFSLSSAALWPPNHKLVDIAASYTTSDPSGPVSCSLGVASNEPQNGLGDGDTDVDWLIASATALQLRAERAGTGTGRVYTVTLTCEDRFSNRSTKARTVTVAKSR